jgi:predicted nucleic acid-binding protein
VFALKSLRASAVMVNSKDSTTAPCARCCQAMIASVRLVLNTGPLIVLRRAEALDVVGRLPVEFVSPFEVRDELLEGARHGHPPVSPTWVRFVALAKPLDLVARANLGAGEAAVIERALQEGVPRVVIDERRGRRAALAVGLSVTGTLGLLGRAKGLGLVPAVRLFVEALRGALSSS